MESPDNNEHFDKGETKVDKVTPEVGSKSDNNSRVDKNIKRGKHKTNNRQSADQITYHFKPVT